jgi:hypothetical protein
VAQVMRWLRRAFGRQGIDVPDPIQARVMPAAAGLPASTRAPCCAATTARGRIGPPSGAGSRRAEDLARLWPRHWARWLAGSRVHAQGTREDEA